MKLIIEISQEDYERCKEIPDIGVGECLLDNVYNAVKYGKPYEEGYSLGKAETIAAADILPEVVEIMRDILPQVVEIAKEKIKKDGQKEHPQSCEFCKFEDKQMTQEPCCYCKNSHINFFEWKGTTNE